MRTTWMSDTSAPDDVGGGGTGCRCEPIGRPAAGSPRFPVPPPRPVTPGARSRAGRETLPRPVRRQQGQEVVTDVGRVVGREDSDPGEAELVDHRASVADGHHGLAVTEALLHEQADARIGYDRRVVT